MTSNSLCSTFHEKYLTVHIQERHNARFSVTVAVNPSTTVRQVKQRVQKKCLTKDGNLCDLVMLQQDGSKDFFYVNVLQDDELIYDILNRPSNNCSFYLNISKGLKIRVYMEEIVAGMTYKTVVVSPFSTSQEVIKILLRDQPNYADDFYLVKKTTDNEGDK
ncbi:unnamed protein product [Soboliphyme baturini]|uniref:Ras-associating domain-containing protein n=1 Tax=Soboliphyme baturini TaxID=241478 RepID=A0A183IBT7_9BILA|nr:unnamed protein product [Soboliphyme baturini]